ncbi:MAG: NADH-quinone oxidoreductase subunit NuoH [Dehalococcoidia bacterium]
MDWFYELWTKLGETFRGWLEGAVPDSAEGWVIYLVIGFLSMLVLVNIPLIVVPFMIYMERRMLGRMQNRLGPNRVGPFGILQPVADAIKIMTKEDTVPQGADRWVFNIAPVAVMVPVLLIFAVIPFGGKTFLTDLNVGVLFIVAVTAIDTIGVFMAGWASNNKYALFGAMRAVAVLVSYEIPLVLAIMGVVLISGSMGLNDIVAVQTSWPLILFQPLGFLIFFIAVSAELNRSPFDLMEAESEIIAGFHTEYSGMKFVLFLTAEMVSLMGYAAVMSTLYLSGWEGPGLPGYLWLMVKIFFIFGIFIWTRATLPRLRIDQVMAFAWKFLFPLSIINAAIAAIEVVVWEDGLPEWLIPINIAIAIGLIVTMHRLLKFQGQTREVVPSRRGRLGALAPPVSGGSE